MAFYRTTITRFLALAAIVGCLIPTCKGGISQKFKDALANDSKQNVNSPIDWWFQRTPLHIAAREGAVNTVHLLLAKGAEAGLKDRDGATPLHLAALYGKHAVAKELMEANQELAIVEDKQQYMPLHRAIQEHVPEQAEEQAKTAREELVSHLLTTCREQDVETIVKTARVEERESFFVMGCGYAAIHLVAQNGTRDAVQRILGKASSMLDNPGKSNCTPLHLAIKGNQPTVARYLLLDRKAKVDATDVQDRTLLHYATACLHTAEEVISALKELGELVLKELLSKPDNNGRTPLHQAVIEGDFGVVKCLVDEGADKNAEDRFGYTPTDLTENKMHIDAYKKIRGYLLAGDGAKFTPWYRRKRQQLVEGLRFWGKSVKDGLSEVDVSLSGNCVFLTVTLTKVNKFCYGLFCCCCSGGHQDKPEGNDNCRTR